MNIYQCKVCRAPALHFNYGGLSCGSCKIFFRRKVMRKSMAFDCQFDGHCQIDIHNRHLCSACRLRKCFQIGMQTDLIRSSRPKNLLPYRKKLQLPTLNLLHYDNSSLNSAQWALLSNLINYYDERKLVAIARQFIHQSNTLHPQVSIDPSLPTEYFLSAYEISGNYFRFNADFNSLSSNDRSDFLRISVDNVICLGSAFSWYWSQLYNYGPFIQVFKKFYGDLPILNIRKILKCMDPDIVVAKLSISLFAFSNTMSILSLSEPNKFLNTLTIFRIQNIYTELLWKYLVYKYGYYHSIQRFMNLIQSHLAALYVLFNAQSVTKHVHDIESLIEETEISFLLDDFE